MNIINKTEILSENMDGSDAAPGDEMPRRIQLSRKRGWRKPPNTISVARPSIWGNPFKATEDYPVERAIADYEKWLHTDPKGLKILCAAKAELPGKNLACWCKIESPCHADVLLRAMNS
jgi:hypothetical protein